MATARYPRRSLPFALCSMAARTFRSRQARTPRPRRDPRARRRGEGGSVQRGRPSEIDGGARRARRRGEAFPSASFGAGPADRNPQGADRRGHFAAVDGPAEARKGQKLRHPCARQGRQAQRSWLRGVRTGSSVVLRRCDRGSGDAIGMPATVGGSLLLHILLASERHRRRKCFCACHPRGDRAPSESEIVDVGGAAASGSRGGDGEILGGKNGNPGGSCEPDFELDDHGRPTADRIRCMRDAVRDFGSRGGHVPGRKRLAGDPGCSRNYGCTLCEPTDRVTSAAPRSHGVCK